MAEMQAKMLPRPTVDLLRKEKLPLPLYSPDSAWNQRADKVAVDPDNTERLRATLEMLVAEGAPEKKNFNQFFVNHRTFTIPIFSARRDELRLQTYDRKEWATHDPASMSEDGRLFVAGLPQPTGLVRPSGPQNLSSDGSLVLYDAANKTEYDFFQATTAFDGAGKSLGGGVVGPKILEAGGIARFRIDGLGAQITTNDHPLNSARASGLPLLAGLIVPEDIEALFAAGIDPDNVPAIPHALAVALPRLRCAKHKCSPGNSTDFVYPASKAESHNGLSNIANLAAGERIRLQKQLFFADDIPVPDCRKVPLIVRIFFQTLREYGAYVVDASGGVAFYAEDSHTGNLSLSDEQVTFLTDQKRRDDETPWQAVVTELNELLTWRLSDMAGLKPTPVPFIFDGRDGLRNIEVIAPAQPPSDAG